MKKKFLAFLLATSAAISGTLGLTACNKTNDSNKPKWGTEYSYTTAYAQAQELGYAGTLEEFIAMISGKDGTTPHIGENGNWFIGETDTGVKAAGTDGKDGVGIKNANVDNKGHLIVTLTDDREIDCGEVRNLHTHEFGDWTTLMQSDCTNTGLQLRICETCGYTEANLIPATEHIWNDWQNDEESNKHFRECSQCGATESAPHNTTEGVCTDCGTVFSLPEACVPVQGEIISKHNMFYLNIGRHIGVDIKAAKGTNIVAALGGTVEEIVLNDNIDGLYITIVHKNGAKTKYQNINVKSNLKVGDKINQGSVIGTIGDIALANEVRLGAHLHFELYLNGEPVDPEQYIDFGNN